ncbi:MAG TPA: hypothetical protein VF006_33895 [Longimicrobium sp.]
MDDVPRVDVEDPRSPDAAALMEELTRTLARITGEGGAGASRRAAARDAGRIPRAMRPACGPPLAGVRSALQLAVDVSPQPLPLGQPPSMRSLLSRAAPLLCAALLAAPCTLRAQSAAELSPGTRVRVVDPGTGRTVGTIEAVGPDSVVVLSGRGEGARRVTMSLSSIRTLQVSRGTPARPLSALRVAALGALTGTVGGVAGAVLPTLFSNEPCDRRTDDLCFGTTESVLMGVIIGAPFGAAWGAALGFVFPQERWRSVDLRNAPAVTLNGSADGVRLGLSIGVP